MGRSYFLFGLPSVDAAEGLLGKRLHRPPSDDRWVLGAPEAPDAWLYVEAEPEPWYDNSQIEPGPLIVAEVSSARMPASHGATVAFLRSVQETLGGVIRDHSDVRID